MAKIGFLAVVGIAAYTGYKVFKAYRWRDQTAINAAKELQTALDAIPDTEDVNDCLEETPGGQSQRTRTVENGSYEPTKIQRTRRVRAPRRMRFCLHH